MRTFARSRWALTASGCSLPLNFCIVHPSIPPAAPSHAHYMSGFRSIVDGSYCLASLIPAPSGSQNAHAPTPSSGALSSSNASLPTPRASATLSRPASSLLLRCPGPSCRSSYKRMDGLPFLIKRDIISTIEPSRSAHRSSVSKFATPRASKNGWYSIRAVRSAYGTRKHSCSRCTVAPARGHVPVGLP